MNSSKGEKEGGGLRAAEGTEVGRCLLRAAYQYLGLPALDGALARQGNWMVDTYRTGMFAKDLINMVASPPFLPAFVFGVAVFPWLLHDRFFFFFFFLKGATYTTQLLRPETPRIWPLSMSSCTW